MTLLSGSSQAGEQVALLTCLSWLFDPYCTGHRSVHRNGCDAPPVGPGFVTITFPDPPGWSPLHTFLTSLSVVGVVVPP